MAGIVVVGGGVAGLVCAWRLQRAGHDVQVLEQASAAGGRLRAVQHGSHRIQAGASFVTNGQRNVLGLAATLGLADSLVHLDPGAAVPGRVLREGRFEPCSIGLWPELSPSRKAGARLQLLRSPVLPLAARLRMARLSAELFRQRDRLDPVQPERAARLENGEDMTRYLGRTLGDVARDRLVAPFVSALLGCEPEDVGAAFFLLTLRSLVQGAEPVTFAGGLARLTEELAAAVPVRSGCEVFSVESQRTGARIRYRSNRREHSFLADAVVVAVPGPVVPQICRTLTSDECGFFDSVGYAPAIQVDLLLETPPGGRVPLALDDCYGACFQRSAGREKRSAIRSVFLSHREPGAGPPGSGHLTVQLAEHAVRQLARAKDGEIVGFTTDALARTPIGLLPSHEAVVQRWANARPLFPLGALSRLEHFGVRIARSPRLAFAGDYLIGPTVEGALTSGMRAASRVVQSLDDTGSRR